MVASGATSADVASAAEASAEDEPGPETSSRVALTPLPSVLRSAVWMRLRVVALVGSRPVPVRL